MFAVASFAYMVGTFSVLAMLNVAREQWLEACLYAVTIPALAAAAVFVARRTLRKIPEQSP